ncbi:hypothetical protein [Bacteroides acidifaciens]|uniref:hypothetical protein n=1 Tax=Bacteroides acidifaciens TaxID=85831 RepID=UPI00272BA766|nr:hypothetical protein [Bacteroides acidifaciens]
MNDRSPGLASKFRRRRSSKSMRLWLRSACVSGLPFVGLNGRRLAIIRGALLIPCCALKPNIIAMLSVHTSKASPSPLIHWGIENTVPSATVETATSPKRTPALPAVLVVALAYLSATLPIIGDSVPVTLPRTRP